MGATHQTCVSLVATLPYTASAVSKEVGQTPSRAPPADPSSILKGVCFRSLLVHKQLRSARWHCFLGLLRESHLTPIHSIRTHSSSHDVDIII